MNRLSDDRISRLPPSPVGGASGGGAGPVPAPRLGEGGPLRRVPRPWWGPGHDGPAGGFDSHPGEFGLAREAGQNQATEEAGDGRI